MDPLQLLREWTMEGKLKQIKLDANRVEFGDSYSFKRDMLTSYKSEKAKGPFYALDALLTFLRERSTPFPAYVQRAKEVGVRTVSYLDRKDVDAYLTGLTSTSEYIEQSAPELNFAELPQDAGADDTLEPAAKRARLESGAAAGTSGPGSVATGTASTTESLMDAVAKGERRLRDRTSMLMVPHKSFASVLLKAKDILVTHGRSQGFGQDRAKAKPAAIPVKRSNRTERSAPDTTLQSMGFADISIQTYGPGTNATAATGSAAPVTLPPPQSAAGSRPEPSSAPRRPVLLPNPKPAPAAPASRPSSGQKPARPSSSSIAGAAPIIIVPKGFDTKLNMFNAKAFLEEGKFQKWEDAQAAGVRKSSKETFKRTIGRTKPVVYHVTDAAPDKRDPTWRRVVAVFVQGKDWQFRGWPFKGVEEGDMVDSFSRMLAVYLAAPAEAVPPSVRSWNCRIFRLHPSNRHGDMQLVRDFYEALDALLGARKSQLKY
mmetsp:Transcript_6388/g.18404  ORF Transcript_6388/g.18404 Transcript_6388/m.18404 type:complete len:487 (-) Transcript_6388:337-1797(-)|eukprot:CAMPEP_0206144972 /NCGR_PEP_ID=MMETSP1473-20131121/25981_1 /ASSEMBLY_ACC=CAM_ASM_001109 /TAXON_ID=1461547 /ORGANISM="Stichococcus sp, Strain RCC1054" /LENGTH=486 /DNA_ID=CAMNT_0053541009 /DNA_START=331 /DNA_END=1791 /DNA_ORIENTATION=-